MGGRERETEGSFQMCRVTCCPEEALQSRSGEWPVHPRSQKSSSMGIVINYFATVTFPVCL